MTKNSFAGRKKRKFKVVGKIYTKIRAKYEEKYLQKSDFIIIYRLVGPKRS